MAPVTTPQSRKSYQRDSYVLIAFWSHAEVSIRQGVVWSRLISKSKTNFDQAYKISSDFKTNVLTKMQRYDLKMSMHFEFNETWEDSDHQQSSQCPNKEWVVSKRYIYKFIYIYIATLCYAIKKPVMLAKVLVEKTNIFIQSMY